MTNPEMDAMRLDDAMERIIGNFHAARCMYAIWIRQTENNEVRHAAKYGLQMAFGTMLLMLRKFKGLYIHHISRLGQDERAESILSEYKSRRLAPTVNLLFAHYAARENKLPLSRGEVEKLIRSNKWKTEEEVLQWAGPILDKLIAIKDDLKRKRDI